MRRDQSLKNLQENLLDNNFIQMHKPFIVSKRGVDQITGNQLIIQEYKIPISVRMKKEVLKKFTN
ncbi:hypothetical protein GTQ40_08425 [Flavobacteriaceae bacterium R38]|nr:hypothetical protein [Flavobacteriaceae bacterium R38]